MCEWVGKQAQTAAKRETKRPHREEKMVETATWKHLPWSNPNVFTVPKTGLSSVYTIRGTYENVEKAFTKAINEWYDTYLFTTRGYKIHVHWCGEARLRRGHKVVVLDITSKNCRKQKYKNLAAYVWQAAHMNPVIGFDRCYSSTDDLFII